MGSQTRSLYRVLTLFNCPVTVEQAWALAHMCAWTLHTQRDLRVRLQLDTVHLSEDGVITLDPSPIAFTPLQLLHDLGKVLYAALDFNIPESEERGDLPSNLEDLIDRLTFSSDEEAALDDTFDEGIGDNCIVGCEEVVFATDLSGHISSFEQVMRLCRAAAAESQSIAWRDADEYYRKVCVAIAAEAKELQTFLDKVQTAQHNLQKLRESDITDYSSNYARERDLEDLHSTEWAKLWMQVMRQMREGVSLKSVHDRKYKPVTRVYELAPYEVLMQEIRMKKYKLRSIEDKPMSRRLRKDAHEVILDFIKSRPSLKPIDCLKEDDHQSQRKMSHNTVKMISVREKMLNLIQTRPPLKHIQTPNFNRGLQLGRVVDVTEHGEKRYEGSRLLLRPSSLMNLDLDEVSCTEDEGGGSEDDKVFSDAESPVNGRPHQDMDEEDGGSGSSSDTEVSSGGTPTPQASDVDDLVREFSQPRPPRNPTLYARSLTVEHSRRGRRLKTTSNHPSETMELKSIADCAKPGVEVDGRDFLNLTVDEMIHIRQVLTKAELDNLHIEKTLHNEIRAEKICFICKTTRFSLFKKCFRCRFCEKAVCKSCCRLIVLPAGLPYLRVPITILSPTPSRYLKNPNPPSDTTYFDTDQPLKSSQAHKERMAARGRSCSPCGSMASSPDSSPADPLPTRSLGGGSASLLVASDPTGGGGRRSSGSGPAGGGGGGKSQVCRSCRRFLKHVLNSTGSSQYPTTGCSKSTADNLYKIPHF